MFGRGNGATRDVTYDEQRARMVETQLVARGIRNQRVLEAMRIVPRHEFVPHPFRDRTYDDHPIDIGNGQTISQPYMVALMTELLVLRSTDRVLEVGTGSGYQAAVLATLAHRVTSIERFPELAERAAATLARLGYDNVDVVSGDGTLGWPEAAPYDAIIVTAAAPEVPRALPGQLVDGGRLVCPAGPRDVQRLERIVRHGDAFPRDSGIKCMFVPLIGAQGWPI